MGKTSLVCGVGINDSDYITNPNNGGVRNICQYYRAWHSMLNRCYNKAYTARRPTYEICLVCEAWLTFSNFKAWMETQDWIGKELDKDLICSGNNVYCPEACVFLDPNVNKFLTDRKRFRGKYMIGASWHKSSGKFQSQCGDGRMQKYLGTYDTELEAHLAWKTYKHRLACKLADEQTDLRVAAALRQRYL